MIPIKQGTKGVPCMGAWKEYSETVKITDEMFDKWTAEYPGCNWAVLTGALSNLVVLDIDSKEALEELEHRCNVSLLDLDTVICLTGSGRGYHFYFQYPKHISIKNSASKIGEHIDIRGAGGLIVTPPSIHPESHKPYQWVAGHSPNEVSVLSFPKWLENILLPDKKAKEKAQKQALTDAEVETLLHDGAPEGQRNDATARVAGYFLGKGMGYDEALALVQQWNSEKNNPPLDDEEIERTVSSIWNNEEMKFLTDKGNLKYARLAQYLIDEYHVKYIEIQRTLYLWDKDHYVADPDYLHLREIVGRLIGHGIVFKKHYDNLLDTLLEHPEIKVPDVPVISDRILFNNGIYNFNTDETVPPSHDKFMVIRLPHNYNKEAQCPEFLKYLTDTLEPDYIPTIQEYMGYCLTTMVKYHTAMIFYGDGGNGKSVLIDIINAMVSGDNYSALDLDKLCSGKNRFAVIDLRNKLVNSSAENTTSINHDMDTLKALIAGDALYAEAKGKQGFKFRPLAKHIFSLNELPRFRDTSNATKRRFIIIKFLKNFKGTKADRGLSQRIITTEMEGIIAWAIEGLKRLESQRDFTRNDKINSNLAEMELSSSSIAAFISDCCTVAPGVEHKSSSLYDSYAEYCKKNGWMPVAMRNLADRILQKCPDVQKVRRRDAVYLTGITVMPQ
jgi:P4 family phage/plasmid primase-like protien